MNSSLQHFFSDNPYDSIDSDDESESANLNEFDGNQITIDIVYGVLRDWTCIAAGLHGPWTESSEYSITDVLDGHGSFPSYPSTTMVPQWNAPNFLAATTQEDLISIGDSTGAARRADSSRSRRRLTTVRETLGRTSACLPSTDLIDDVSSRKRRRIFPNMPASSRDVPVDYGNLRNHIDALPSLSRNPEARASTDRRVTSDHQQARQKSQATQIEDPTTCQKARQSTAHPSRLPLTSKVGCSSALFVSELIPSSFTPLQRFQVLDVLHYEAPYIPTCIVGATGQAPQLYFGSLHCNRHLLPKHTDDKISQMSQALGPPTTVKSNVILPVEVLAHIARYLKRSDMQALLLTSKEYNAKLGPLYFQHIVLPFKSNIFSGLKNISVTDSMHGKEKILNSATLPAASILPTTTHDTEEDLGTLPSDLNMFKTWGSSIMKFAFSLEADQDELTEAPEKQVMNTYSTFYEQSTPWPAQEYLLNPKIQKLEMTADQTNLMELAFSSLTNVNEFALAVDSGLGYLEGFDKSDRAKIVTDKAKVFGRRFALSKEGEIRSWLEVSSSVLARFSLHDREIYNSYVKLLALIPRLAHTLIDLVTHYMNKNPRGTLSHLAYIDISDHVKTVMLDLGVLRPDQQPRQWSTAQDLLLAARSIATSMITDSIGNQTPSRSWPTDLHMSVVDPNSYYGHHSIAPSGIWVPDNLRHGLLPHLPAWVDTRTFNYADNLQLTESRDKFSMHSVRGLSRELLIAIFYRPVGSPPPLIFDGVDLDDPIRPAIPENFTMRPLKPRSLTLAQKQWLVETGWVQQAFLTSYITSIIKNKPMFATVRSFTLAKLSSSYLPRLHDRELWGALCNVENLTILVSPDWREIISGHEGEFSSLAVAPSRACSMLTKLLYDLSSISAIKSLKTGFVGGGELAVGIFARNQHLLPAPITDKERSKRHIVMPFIENITFVNCWFVPSMLMAFLQDMLSLKLRTVHFDSVSLLVAGGKTTSFPSLWPTNLPQELVADPSTGTVPPFYLGFGVRQPNRDAVVRQSQVTPAYVRPEPPTQDGYAVPVSWRGQRLHPDTWAEIIDAYTPGQTLQDKRAAFVGEAADLKSHVERKTPFSLEFTSCGYAKLGYQVLGPVLDESQEPDDTSGLARRKMVMRLYMMTSTDPFQAVIVPKLIHPELALLTGGFGMRVGPGNDPGRLDNREDGKPDRGTGRFWGKLVRA
ncbi:hypothetical protein MMC18_007497 [Xylographa bjoerkii]|nr:hypothetical protein [Xylographa bjoerkii]